MSGFFGERSEPVARERKCASLSTSIAKLRLDMGDTAPPCLPEQTDSKAQKYLFKQNILAWLDSFHFEAFFTVRWPKTLPLHQLPNRLKNSYFQKIMEITKCRIAGVSAITTGENVNSTHTLLLPMKAGAITANMEELQALLNKTTATQIKPAHSTSNRYTAGHYAFEGSDISIYGANILQQTLNQYKSTITAFDPAEMPDENDIWF